MGKQKKRVEIDPAILMSYLCEEASLQPPPSAYIPFESVTFGENINFFDKPGMEASQAPAAPIGEELNRIVTKEELAEILKVSPGYIDSLRRKGKIPCFQEKRDDTAGQRVPIRFNLKEVLDALRYEPVVKRMLRQSRLQGRRRRGDKNHQQAEGD